MKTPKPRTLGILGGAATLGGLSGGLIQLGHDNATLITTNTQLVSDLKETKEEAALYKLLNTGLTKDLIDLNADRNKEAENYERIILILTKDNEFFQEENRRLMIDNEHLALTQLEMDKEIEKTYDINLILNRLDDIISNTVEVDLSGEDRTLLTALYKTLLTHRIVSDSDRIHYGLLYNKLEELSRKLESLKPS